MSKRDRQTKKLKMTKSALPTLHPQPFFLQESFGKAFAAILMTTIAHMVGGTLRYQTKNTHCPFD
jgi:hypothetical protein